MRPPKGATNKIPNGTRIGFSVPYRTIHDIPEGFFIEGSSLYKDNFDRFTDQDVTLMALKGIELYIPIYWFNPSCGLTESDVS